METKNYKVKYKMTNNNWSDWIKMSLTSQELANLSYIYPNGFKAKLIK